MRLHQVAAVLAAVLSTVFGVVQLVQARRQSLGLAATVTEDDGAAMRKHLLQYRGIDARPNAAVFA